jgi:hypothetical protein
MEEDECDYQDIMEGMTSLADECLDNQSIDDDKLDEIAYNMMMKDKKES